MISFSATVVPEPAIFLEFIDMQQQSSEFQILDTIDLTEASQNIIDTNNKGNVLEKVSDIMDEQLTCSICSELFINATTLNCTHTFCHHCIVSWNKKGRRDCPVCRKIVVSMNRSLVLDNFIESMIENLPTELKDKRKEIVNERKGKIVYLTNLCIQHALSLSNVETNLQCLNHFIVFQHWRRESIKDTDVQEN